MAQNKVTKEPRLKIGENAPYLISIICPGSKFHVTTLLIKWKPFNIDLKFSVLVQIFNPQIKRQDLEDHKC